MKFPKISKEKLDEITEKSTALASDSIAVVEREWVTAYQMLDDHIKHLWNEVNVIRFRVEKLIELVLEGGEENGGTGNPKD